MRIGLLGPLAVYDEAGRPVRVGGPRVRLLLILLALDADHVVPASSLIERLWEDDPPANAGNSLQSAVSRLRACLREAGLGDDMIESHPAGYRLAVPPRQVDAAVFEDLAREGGRALAAGDPAAAQRLLAQALAAWRGPALADAAGMDFAAGPAARLAETRARAGLDLAEAGLALGETEAPIAGLRAMIAADPLAERPCGLLMRALSAAGRRSEALAVYAQTRELLADRFGSDPSPQLQEVYLDVLRQQPGERPARGQSPPRLRGSAVRKPLTSFVGRDEDVERVRAMLGTHRLVTLTGPGGAGKTRLAVELAARLASGQQAAPPRVWFVDLTPVAEPADVPYTVLHALGIRESPVLARAGAGAGSERADPAHRLAAALGHDPHLLILDNCEHMVAAAAALADHLLANCPAARVLATSREPLRVGGEALWPVPPLPVPPAAQQASDVAGYASVTLLADRAAAVRPGFEVDAANAADVARICRALDGMPLAIELAAARLRTLSPAQLADRLGARFELLTAGSRTASPRHQTLRAVVDWSWELLSGPEQMLARRLAAFSGGATLNVAEQVCAGGTLAADGVLPAMFGLVEKSFVVVDDAGGDDPRYRMLETVRAYCVRRLAEAGEEGRTGRAFAGYFLRLAETADPLLRSGTQREWLRRLTAEQDNVNAALRWALDHRDPGLALRFGQALAWFWLLRGHRQESGAMARDILAISAPAPGADRGPAAARTVQARAVCALIRLNASWDIDEVRQPLLDAEALMTQGSRDGVAEGLDGRPFHPLALLAVALVMLYDRRDVAQAARLIEGHFSSSDPWTRAGARMMHATFSIAMGRPEQVGDSYDEALAGFRALGDRWGTAMTLTSRAEQDMLGGDYLSAVAALEEALALSRELTEWEDTAQMHAYLAKCRSRLGDREGALAELSQAERLFRAQGEPDDDLWICHIRTDLAWLSGDFAQVSGICQELEDRIADKPGLIWNFVALIEARHGLADLRLGVAAGGRARLASALGHARASQDRTSVAAVMDALAAGLLSAGDGRDGADRAAALLGAAHAVRGVFDHGSLDAPDTRDLARQVLGEQDFDAAYQRGRALGYEEALRLAESAAAAVAAG